MIHTVQGNIYFKKTTQMHQQWEVLKCCKRLRIEMSLEKMEARRCQSGTKQVNAKHTAESLIQHQVRLESMSFHLIMDFVAGLWQGPVRREECAPQHPVTQQQQPTASFTS